eukprot:TRINITY_DN46404_c0_g1_i1.p1 TRINITY_DN46404_c0_g1~~TRINITY_DN46404_c0_g1_i1.p1  ORF type:complete len:394 (+),score=15.00 TRINITY_DN46404_c0_g1_i1:58-1239(+)
MDSSAVSEAALTVCLLGGEQLNVDFSGVDSISGLRFAIAQAYGLLSCQVQLFHDGTCISDHDDLTSALAEGVICAVFRPETIHVLCRIRPLLRRGIDYNAVEAVRTIGATTVQVDIEGSSKSFDFGSVFHCGSQEEVFEFCKEVVHVAADSCIIAYGQTGAGKTFTMYGPHGVSDPEFAGVVPRCAHELFESGSALRVSVSMLEYSNKLTDLLQDDETLARVDLKVRHLPENDCIVEGLTEVECASAEEILACLAKAHSRRMVALTNMGTASSRSSLIAIFKIHSGTVGSGEQGSTRQLVLVDLAGSERSPRHEVNLREARYINSTLVSLRNVLVSYADGKKFVPYRDSKLTMILRKCIPRTYLIAVCSPSNLAVDETMHTLRCAQHMCRKPA